MERYCGHCGEHLHRNSNETVDRFIDRKYCGFKCHGLYRMTHSSPSYLSLYLIGCEVSLRTLHKYAEEVSNISLPNFYANYISKGVSPSVKDGGKVALAIGRGLYIENERYFFENPFDYRRLFRASGGAWIHGTKNVLTDLTQGIIKDDMTYEEYIKAQLKACREGVKTDSSRAAYRLYYGMLKYLKSIDSYEGDAISATMRIVFRRRDQITPSMARDFTLLLSDFNVNVDYRCLLEERKFSYYKRI